MKTVFSGKELFHVFASNTQSHGRGGNVSFRDSVLYSYRAPIARIIEGADQTAIITARKYSVTTSKHVSMARRALSHYRVFVVPEMARDYKSQTENLAYLAGRYADCVAENMKGRKLPFWIEETEEGLKPAVRTWAPEGELNPLKELAEQFSEYSILVGQEAPEPHWQEDTRRILAHHAARIAKANTPSAIAKREKARAKRAEENAQELARIQAEREAREAERLAREAEEDATRAERIEAWRKGGASLFHRDLASLPGALLRVRGDVLETSHGASVPLEDAKRVFAFIARNIGKEVTDWQVLRAGKLLSVGRYSLDEVFANGDFRAGCHKITWAEASRIAQEIGFAPSLIEA